MRVSYPLRRAQRGWIGFVVLLLALAIVAMLAKNALTAYGLAGSGNAGRTVTRGASAEALDAPAPPPMSAPLDQARAIEGMVRQGADERARAVDAAAR